MKYDELYYRNFCDVPCRITLERTPYPDHNLPEMLIRSKTIRIYNNQNEDEDYTTSDIDDGFCPVSDPNMAYDRTMPLACSIKGYMVYGREMRYFGYDYLKHCEKLPLDLRCAARSLKYYIDTVTFDFFFISTITMPEGISNYEEVKTRILRDMKLICFNVFGSSPEVIMCCPKQIYDQNKERYWFTLDLEKENEIFEKAGFVPFPDSNDVFNYGFLWQLFDCGKGANRTW